MILGKIECAKYAPSLIGGSLLCDNGIILVWV